MSRFSILMYHMISSPLSKAEAKYACPSAQFDKHMQQLISSGGSGATLCEARCVCGGRGDLREHCLRWRGIGADGIVARNV